MKRLFLLTALLGLASCSSGTSDPDTQPQPQRLYFPPVNGNEWLTKTPSELQWDESKIQPLLDYLELKNTKSFLILVDGKIVIEHYFDGHTATTPWYWASAGKTLTATAFGIAEQQGLAGRNDAVSEHLGIGWTSLPVAKESLIKNHHLLTMTSGIEDLDNGDCVTPDCLTYAADAGTRWAYHNVYVKLQDVIAEAAGKPYQTYFNENLRDPIGMTGTWLHFEDNVVYWSTTRSMARFGLLMLNKGKWDQTVILNENYFDAATNTAQQLNPAYGYLWWLNGKSYYRLPQTQFQFQGSIIPSGPSDMFMALGKNDQKLYIIPSKRMVVVRMGNAADAVNPALSDFDAVLWEHLSALYP